MSEARFSSWKAGHPAVVRTFACLAVLLIPLLGFGCAPAVQVRTAQAPQSDLTSYESFAMMLPNKPVPSDNTKMDPFVMQRIRQLAYARLKAMGYRPESRKRADLIVNVLAAQDTRYYSHSSPSFSYYPYTMRGGWTETVSEIDEGTIVIDLVDRKKGSAVWRGTGVKALGNGLSEADLSQIVDTILQQYPFRSGFQPPAVEK